jgi:hypothetical protein
MNIAESEEKTGKCHRCGQPLGVDVEAMLPELIAALAEFIEGTEKELLCRECLMKEREQYFNRHGDGTTPGFFKQEI